MPVPSSRAAAEAAKAFAETAVAVNGDPHITIDPAKLPAKLAADIDSIIQRYMDTAFTMGTNYISVADTALARHPEDFGRALAYTVFGDNAGFDKVETFTKTGTPVPADTLKAVADRAGFNCFAEIVDYADTGLSLTIAYGK